MTDWGRLAVWVWITGIVILVAFATVPRPPVEVLWVGVG